MTRTQSRSLHAEILEDRRLLAGDFLRTDSPLTSQPIRVFASTSPSAPPSPPIGTQYVLAHSDKTGSASDDGYSVFAHADVTGMILTPPGATTGVPSSSSSATYIAYAHSDGGITVGAQAFNQAGASGGFRTLSAGLFHGTVFIAAYGGDTASGDAGGGQDIDVGNSGIAGGNAQARSLGGDQWAVTANTPQYSFSATATGGVNEYFHFVVNLAAGQNIGAVSGLNGQVSVSAGGEGGTAQSLWNAASGAWGFFIPAGGGGIDQSDGDFNQDGSVDGDDFQIWENGQETDDPNSVPATHHFGEGAYLPGDADDDGDVDDADYGIWLANTTTLVVSTLNDELDTDYSYGDLSLREALYLTTQFGYTAVDTITFSSSLLSEGPASITLAYDGSDTNTRPDELMVAKDLVIEGFGAEYLSISGDDLSRVFHVGNVNATIRGMTITNGNYSLGDPELVPEPRVGGAVLNEGDLILDSVIVKDSVGYAGGGVGNLGDSLLIINSTVANNDTQSIGGGIYTETGEVTVKNSTISHNLVGISIQDGGGYADGPASLNIINSTVSNNISDNIYSQGSNVDISILNTTITQALTYDFFGELIPGGTGIRAIGADVILRNSIVAGNGSDIIGSGGAVFAGTHNLIGDDGTNTFVDLVDDNHVIGSADPLLAPLMNYGGPTATHALLEGSLAFDGGNNDFVNGTVGDSILYDQRGVPFARVMDDAVDIGAFESMNLSFLGVGSLADEMDGIYVNGEMALREALAMAAEMPGPDVIYFVPSLIGQTVTLTQGELVIDSDVDIRGPGANMLTIDADGESRVVSVNSGISALISGLTLTGGTEYNGGAIYSAGNLSLEGMAIEGNIAYAGGGVYQTGGSLIIDGSTVSANYSGGQGGGIYINSSTDVLIMNSTISTNSTVHAGGGLYVNGSSSDVSLAHDTITNNSVSQSTGQGGGLHSFSGTVTMTHTIVAGNFVNGNAKDVYLKIAHADATHNLIGIGTIGNATEGLLTNGTNHNIIGVADPGLTPLDYHGGTVKTHALLAGSLAIDAGDAAIADAPEFDQRGEIRIVDGDDDEEAVIDIGAFELAIDELYS